MACGCNLCISFDSYISRSEEEKLKYRQEVLERLIMISRINVIQADFEVVPRPFSTSNNLEGIYDPHKKKITIFPYSMDNYIHVRVVLHEVLHWRYHRDVSDPILKEVLEGLVDSLTFSLICKNLTKEFKYFSSDLYQTSSKFTLSMLLYQVSERDGYSIEDILEQWERHELIQNISREIREGNHQCYPLTPYCIYSAVDITSKVTGFDLEASLMDPNLFCK
ncbi:hypothetical protein [Metallosphaera javensis (ex Sakai et al. 2022)]|uniref:hypothetical protein n=1 Tax=Metallosphaera javensis (ex Sakai et al. 2022) TaxID=2775498 RepID=UPI00258FBBC7|nr:MAG: hypothetical protein MjAS7_1892 [Metallosphaera javensis (ex Sakai et al. 2022)]